MSAEVSLSIVVPAYNEAGRISEPLREIGEWLEQRAEPVELILVDDGSSDDTSELLTRIAAELRVPVTVLGYGQNRGKGYALKVGFAAARGARILFTDADLSTPLAEADRLLASLEQGADLAIGSRKTSGSHIEVHQAVHREWMGKVFTWLVRGLISNVTDATCGFKAFRGEVGRDLFSRMRIYDWSFDAELLLLARRRGLRVAEVPVHWADRAGTKVNVLRDALRSLEGLLRIRVADARGQYQNTHPLENEPRVLYSNCEAESRSRSATRPLSDRSLAR